MINNYLQGKEFFVGNSMTLADIVIFNHMVIPFTFTLGAKQQAQIPNLLNWFNMMRTNQIVISVAGLHKLSAEPLKMPGSTAELNCEAPKATADEEEDMDDLFGDEDEEAAAEARDHAAMLRGKAFEAKKKAAAEAAGKVAPEAKSLILWEVKPVDDETNLDDLAKRILAITNEKGGLFWKTEYKKAPIAFGIFKLIIGATIHDNLVSTDDIQEKIEEMDDMVQSVDI